MNLELLAVNHVIEEYLARCDLPVRIEGFRQGVVLAREVTAIVVDDDFISRNRILRGVVFKLPLSFTEER